MYPRDPTISGKEFNAKNSKPLHKITNRSANHRGVVYKHGRVNDVMLWDPRECKPGGIYITDQEHIGDWKCYDEKFFMTRMFEVTIPDDAKVVVFKAKIKASSIVIVKEVTDQYHNTLTEEELELVKKSSLYEYRAELEIQHKERMRELALSGKIPVKKEFNEIYRQMIFDGGWGNVPDQCKNYRSLYLYLQRYSIWEWKLYSSDIKIIKDNREFFKRKKISKALFHYSDVTRNLMADES